MQTVQYRSGDDVLVQAGTIVLRYDDPAAFPSLRPGIGKIDIGELPTAILADLASRASDRRVQASDRDEVRYLDAVIAACRAAGV